jgi:nucleoid DNA-binding protein
MYGRETINKELRYGMPNKRMTRSEFVTALAEKSGLNKQQASLALDGIRDIVTSQLGLPEPCEVLIPGLLILSIVDKPATPQHEGVNPFTKEPMTFKAKPARKVIKVRTLKALKDAV